MQQRNKIVAGVALALSIMAQQSNAALLSFGGLTINVGTTTNPLFGVAFGEFSFAGLNGVSLGRSAGAGSSGDNGTYIGANNGFGTVGEFNTFVGAGNTRNVIGSGNSVFGATTGCNYLVGTPFGQACGSNNVIEGNLNTLLGSNASIQVIGDRNLSAGTNSGSVNGFDNVSFGTNSGPGKSIGGEVYVGNDFTGALPIQVSNTVSIGTNANSTSNSSITIGTNSSVFGDLKDGNVGSASIAIGSSSFIGGVSDQSVALGASAQVKDARSATSLGSNSLSSAEGSVALGAFSVANVENTVSIGNNELKREILNVAAGTTATSAVNLSQVQSLISSISPLQGDGPISITGLIIEPSRTVVGINAAAADGTNSVALGGNSVSTTNNEVSFGNQEIGLSRRLTNLSDGVLNSDAATFGQVNNLFDNFLASLPVINPNPILTTPIPQVVEKPVYVDDDKNTNLTNIATTGVKNTIVGNNAGLGNVGDGNTFIGNETGGINDVSSNSVAIGTGAKAGTNSVALGAGSIAADNAVSVGSAGNERKITNVATGTATTDAVNVNQLNDGLSAISASSRADYNALNTKVDRSINGVRKEIKEIGRRAYGGTALALAIGNHSETAPNGAQIQLGVGNFNGESAIALSTSMAAENGTVFSVGGGITSSGDIGIRGGISFSWNPEWNK